ncbi:leucoanthocyanidin reductase-like [Magnolia sinica]|uniref:leucoanthocyanidin reductase-like n=1 Tax=Magnolia sinica TaxID=86752 RepID=UPI00265B3F9A|nr:leucoanthocyanidin reductase-like [Magnolia sinica]
MPVKGVICERRNRSANRACIISSMNGDAFVSGLVGWGINDRDFMEKTLKDLKIDVVISAVGEASILDQLTLVDAIQTLGTVKRFLPSEFGHDVDQTDPVEPGLAMYKEKRKVRRAVKASRVPYTYKCCNSIATWPYHDNTHPTEVLSPLDRFQIYGDGRVKAYFCCGTDIGKFTVKTIDDDRVVNKTVHFNPTCNFLNINELANLWEKKIGRTLPRVIVTEEDLLATAKELRIATPKSFMTSFTHDIFIGGCQINFPVEGPKDIEVSQLYPDIPFRTMDKCFDDYIIELQHRTSNENAKSSSIKLQHRPSDENSKPNSIKHQHQPSDELAKPNSMETGHPYNM